MIHRDHDLCVGDVVHLRTSLEYNITHAAWDFTGVVSNISYLGITIIVITKNDQVKGLDEDGTYFLELGNVWWDLEKL